jgi:outer membrane lipoprotein LolB
MRPASPRPHIAVIGAALLASGCATLPPAEDGLDLGARRHRLAQIERWDLRGRLVIDTGERAYQARYRWLQDGATLQLTVRGLLGAGSFEIAGDSTGLELRSRGERRLLLDPEAELSALYGWWLPVTSLADWLRGLPDPAHPARPELGTRGTLAALDQRLWHIDFDRYQLLEDLLLPERMRLGHASLKIELTIDRFEPIEKPDVALN